MATRSPDAQEDLAARIVADALAGSRADLLDATMVYMFARDPFATWCDRHAPASEKDEVDKFQELLFEQGREHEANVVAKRYPDASPLAYDTPEEGFRLVVEAMVAGAPAIHGGPVFFLPDGVKGRIDVLERREGASRLGAHHYVVKEVKPAKNIGDHHRLQAAFYHRILGKLQGFTPPQYYVINRDHEETAFAYDEPELLATLRGIRAIHGGLRPPAIHGGGISPWESFTDRCAREARDVSLVAGVGRSTRDKLVSGGFATVDQLAAADPERLVAIRGVGEKSAAKFRTNAEAIVRGTHIPIGAVSFPRVTTEIFLDLEGTGAQTSGEELVEMDYLIGALVRRDGHEAYVSFVAQTPEREGEMWRAFVAWLATQDDYEIYHWHHYEVTHFRKLAQRHGLAPEMHARLFGRMRDLYKDATGAFAFPTPSNSIKKIAPYMGFEWRHKDVGAMESIAMYFEYVRDPAAHRDKLQKVLDYNEDDCIAMKIVKDWLVKNTTEN